MAVQGTMAGNTGGCVLLEVQQDRCTVRTTTNESKHSQKINKKEGVTMSIKWNPLKVNEAMDRVEEQVNQVIEPLEKARIVAREALNIPNIPQYVTQHINRIIGDIDQAIGGSQWNQTGRLKAGIQSVRNDLPKDAIEEEKKKLENGSQLSLVN
jgi:hypothetical protein